MSTHQTRILGFAAYSGSGKTTLLKKIIPELTRQGLKLAVIKHSHHDFELDTPGKDSYELRHAGAYQTLITSSYRCALITEQQPAQQPELKQVIQQLDLDNIDLVLVEGFRDETDIAQIEIHRPSTGKPLIHPARDNVIAIACDQALDFSIPTLDLNRPQQIVEFINRWLSQTAQEKH